MYSNKLVFNFVQSDDRYANGDGLVGHRSSFHSAVRSEAGNTATPATPGRRSKGDRSSNTSNHSSRDN